MRRALPALLVAAAAGLAGGCSRPPILPETPSSAVSPAAVTFTAPGAGYDPLPQTLSVLSPQGGPLVVTGVSLAYASGSGWLSAEVVDAQASPARIAVRARAAGLASGKYEATLYVHADGVVDSPRPVHVTFEVPYPRAALSAGELTFVAPLGGGDPAPQQVLVTNAGGGTLAPPTVSAPSWISASVVGSADPYTIVVQPHVDAFAQWGGFGEILQIWSPGASNAPAEVRVALVLDTPRVDYSPASVAFAFDPAGPLPGPKDVAVSLRTPARLTASPPAASVSYWYTTGADWLSAQMTGSGSSYTLRLQPKGAVLATLANGTYRASVNVTQSQSPYPWTGLPLDVRLVVSPGIAAIVLPTPSEIYGNVLRGAAGAAPWNVTVVDGLGGTLAEPTASLSYGGQPTGWLSTAVSASGPNGSPSSAWNVAVQPIDTGLAAGQHVAYLLVGSTGAQAANVSMQIDLHDWWYAAQDLGYPRSGHTATVLPDGKVLLAGGGGNGEELWDPATRSFLHAGKLFVERSRHTATLLPDGRVVVAGGVADCCTTLALQSWEMYDAATGTWRVFRPLLAPRRGHVAAALPDGTVLVAGGMSDATHGSLSSAEIVDPVLTAGFPAPSMVVPRRDASAIALPDGTVLVAGGVDGTGKVTASAEIFDPVARSWRLTGPLAAPRAEAAVVLLADGRVLAAGGSDGAKALASAEIYDPAKGTWSATGSMATARVAPAARLPTGRVLAAGGTTGDLSAATATVEIWDPATGSWSSAGDLPATTSGGTVALSGDLVLVSGRHVEALGNAEAWDNVKMVGYGVPR